MVFAGIFSFRKSVRKLQAEIMMLIRKCKLNNLKRTPKNVTQKEDKKHGSIKSKHC